jgi:hypothetical protein
MAALAERPAGIEIKKLDAVPAALIDVVDPRHQAATAKGEMP